MGTYNINIEDQNITVDGYEYQRNPGYVMGGGELVLTEGWIGPTFNYLYYYSSYTPDPDFNRITWQLSSTSATSRTVEGRAWTQTGNAIDITTSLWDQTTAIPGSTSGTGAISGVEETTAEKIWLVVTETYANGDNYEYWELCNTTGNWSYEDSYLGLPPVNSGTDVIPFNEELNFGSPKTSNTYTSAWYSNIRVAVGSASVGTTPFFVVLKCDTTIPDVIRIEIYKNGTELHSFSRTYTGQRLQRDAQQSLWVHEKNGKIRIAYVLRDVATYQVQYQWGYPAYNNKFYTACDLSRFVIEDFDVDLNTLTVKEDEAISISTQADPSAYVSMGNTVVAELEEPLSWATAYLMCHRGGYYYSKIQAFYVYVDELWWVGVTIGNDPQGHTLQLGQRKSGNKFSVLGITGQKQWTNPGPIDYSATVVYYTEIELAVSNQLYAQGWLTRVDPPSQSSPDIDWTKFLPVLPNRFSGNSTFYSYNNLESSGQKVIQSENAWQWHGDYRLGGQVDDTNYTTGSGANTGRLWVTKPDYMSASDASPDLPKLPIWYLDTVAGEYGYQELKFPSGVADDWYEPYNQGIVVNDDGLLTCSYVLSNSTDDSVTVVFWHSSGTFYPLRLMQRDDGYGTRGGPEPMRYISKKNTPLLERFKMP